MVDATLLAYYSGDTVSGATIPDEIGSNDAAGELLSQAPVDPGMLGSGAIAVGAGGRIELPVSLFTSPWGISFWLSADTASAGGQPTLFNGGQWDCYEYGGIWYTSLSGGTPSSKAGSLPSSPVLVTIGYSPGWIQVEMSDGQSFVAFGSPGTPTYQILLNYMTSLSSYYSLPGKVSQLAIWDGMLSADQKTSLLTQSPLVVAGLEQPQAPTISPPVVTAGTRWRLTLTGAANGTTDALLPAASVQARLRSGSPSYLSAVIPYTGALADAITARPDGELVLEHLAVLSGGSETATEVCRVTLETIQPVISATSGSINLVGHKQTTNSSPTSHAIRPTITSGQTTTRVWSCADCDPAIRPGDTVTYNGQSLTASLISLQITPGSLQVQYSEG